MPGHWTRGLELSGLHADEERVNKNAAVASVNQASMASFTLGIKVLLPQDSALTQRIEVLRLHAGLFASADRGGP